MQGHHKHSNLHSNSPRNEVVVTKHEFKDINIRHSNLQPVDNGYNDNEHECRNTNIINTATYKL